MKIYSTDLHQYHSKNVLEYILNEDGIIISVAGAWDDFANENNGKDIVSYAIVGKPYLDYLSGKVTKQYWLKLFSLLRATGNPAAIDFRCDSPFEKRYFRMTILPEPLGCLRLISECLATEPRKKPLFLYRAKERSKQTMVCCSQCNRLHFKEHWIEADQLARDQLSSRWDVIYGICQDCQQAMELAVRSSTN